MSKRSPKSVEEKLEVVNLYLTHHQSISSLVKQFGITNTILRKAMAANPGARPLLHRDRGSQYTSREYRLVTNQLQLTRSMSRVGKCIDNASIESFF